MALCWPQLDLYHLPMFGFDALRQSHTDLT
jgi:hypothetical protein